MTTVENLSIPSRADNATVPRDRAEIEVGGQKADDWETVWVQLHAKEPWSFFRFTTAERDASAGLFGSDTQFVTGQECTIKMGGVTVIKGLIEVRQVAYDQGRHHVELSGRSLTSICARSSVYVKDMNFDNESIKSAAEKATKGYPVKIKVLGTVPSDVFDELQAWPGEQIWDFIERIARPAGVVVGTDHENNIILAKDYSGRSGSSLIEGVNIKHMQCVFDETQLYQHYKMWASHNGNDGRWGAKAAQLRATFKGGYKYKSIRITSCEQNTTDDFVKKRCKFESFMTDYSKVTASVVVQGWFRDESTLWWPWDQVYVSSPMAPLDEMLGILNVTFTQEDQGGTQTTIDLANPAAFGGTAQHGKLSGGQKDPTEVGKDEPPPFG